MTSSSTPTSTASRLSRRALLTLSVGALALLTHADVRTGTAGLIDVRGWGADPTGRTDSTDALRRALSSAEPDRPIYVSAGNYVVNVDSEGSAALVLNRPRTHLLLDTYARIHLRPNALPSYRVLRVCAPDCVVAGGTIFGEATGHLGDDGEWGHGLEVGAGADRCLLSGIRVSNCWGDGVYVTGHPADVRISGVRAVGNRRQGLSIVDAARPVVTGGDFSWTGRLGLRTAPASGIDIEPNPNTGQSVVGARISDVRLDHNAGHGLVIGSAGPPIEATVERTRAAGNRSSGFQVVGPATTVVITSSEARQNSIGFRLDPGAPATTLINCRAVSNRNQGILVARRSSILTRCVSVRNSSSDRPAPEIDVHAANVRLEAVTVDVRGARKPASHGILIRDGADAETSDCIVYGRPQVATTLDLNSI